MEDLPNRGLVCGQLGTIVESRRPGVVEVALCDRDDRTYSSFESEATGLISPCREPIDSTWAAWTRDTPITHDIKATHESAHGDRQDIADGRYDQES